MGDAGTTLEEDEHKWSLSVWGVRDQEAVDDKIRTLSDVTVEIDNLDDERLLRNPWEPEPTKDALQDAEEDQAEEGASSRGFSDGRQGQGQGRSQGHAHFRLLRVRSLRRSSGRGAGGFHPDPHLDPWWGRCQLDGGGALRRAAKHTSKADDIGRCQQGWLVGLSDLSDRIDDPRKNWHFANHGTNTRWVAKKKMGGRGQAGEVRL